MNYEEIKEGVLKYVRDNFHEEIDKAYEYFFEEEYPEDFLKGTALRLAFINFEDWLICDYKIDNKESFIELYIKNNKGLKNTELKVLNEMQNSIISLYEISSLTPLVIQDIIFDIKLLPPAKVLRKGQIGDLFATRFLKINGRLKMTGCVYPYGKRKEKVLGYINKQFSRYIKDNKPDLTMRDFLKSHSDLFNIIWISHLYK